MKHMLGWMAALALLVSGCATTRIDWGSRIGNYTHDDAVLEMGVPERQATLSDGTIVAEWLRRRGSTYGTFSGHPYSRFHHYNFDRFPDRYLRLVFSPDGFLQRVENAAR